MSNPMKTLALADVAALTLGAQLGGGAYRGILTLPDGTHVAVVQLADDPGKRLNHAAATAWADGVGGVLPPRLGAALLYANAKAQFEPDWYWTSDTLDADTGDKDDASYAWRCSFGIGFQYYFHKSYEGLARAVRLIPLTA